VHFINVVEQQFEVILGLLLNNVVMVETILAQYLNHMLLIHIIIYEQSKELRIVREEEWFAQQVDHGSIVTLVRILQELK
jgi:hypothetical protein